MKWGCIECGKEIPQEQEFCQECEDKQFRKIGGFLFLPLIGLFVTAFSYLVAMTEAFKTLTTHYWNFTWDAKAFFISSLIIYIVMFFFGVFVISLFFKKKKSLPRIYIYFLIAIIVTITINTYLLHILIPDVKIGYNEIAPIIRNIITAFIWIPYFIISVRVKRTFIR
ncbi:DUF2569 family protein [Salmonella enterica]|nr:DUF2569 family protein [Salmonella enterica]EKP2081088.1 DUF2569 family protein [Salmonella enterica]EKP2109501.1 DUF2569 family protein [Salmonella enterica]